MTNEFITPKITDVHTPNDIEAMKKQEKRDRNREDHTPSTTTAHWTIRHTAPKHFFPKTDRNQLKSDEAARSFKDALNSTTLPAWNMNCDEH
eukprot:3934306-Pyramimonas_sp.AAC.1